MGHYDDHLTEDRLGQQAYERRRFYQDILDGRMDKFFDVAQACKMNYVQIPIASARILLEIAQENAVMSDLKKTVDGCCNRVIMRQITDQG